MIEVLREIVEQLRHWKKINKMILNDDHLIELLGPDFTAQSVYDILHPTARMAGCGIEKTFISFSVGYRFCGPTKSCDCARKSVSEKVAASKALMTQSDICRSNSIRRETVRKIYGVDNVFQRKEFVEQNRKNKPAHTEAANHKRRTTVKDIYGYDNIALNEEVRARIIQTNRDRYGADNPLSTKEVQDRCRKTMMDRYGETSPSKVPEIAARTKSTNMARYGVENPSKSPEIIEKIKGSHRRRYKDQVMSRLDGKYTMHCPYINTTTYGDFTCVQCDITFRDRFYAGGQPECPKCEKTRKSYLETEIYDWLKSVLPDEKIMINSRKIIPPLEIDIVIPHRNIAIEMDGLYYHGDEYKEPRYHLDKTELAATAGYDLIHVFEDEWNSRKSIVKQRLMHKFGTTNRIYARKCIVKEISQVECNVFFDDTHIQGSINARHRLGLYHEDKIVAAMSFSKRRFDHGQGYELLRFSSIGTVVGGAGKLLARFVKDNSPDEIVTYADRRWSKGDLYHTLGFEFIGVTPPNYWYFKNKQRFGRMNFQKHKLIKEGFSRDMTERQIMLERGFRRIYDCGNLKFVKKYLK